MTKPKSGRYPWFKFRPRFWLSDAELNSCSRIARSVWIDLICFMHEADEGGYLILNGKPPKPAALARMLGMVECEFVVVLAELEDAGVFSRRATDGAIYCRRSVRDALADGWKAEGSPGGDPPDARGTPEGDPKGTPRAPQGSPPSRARASQSSEEGKKGRLESGEERSVEGREGDPPARKARGKASGAHPELIQFWEAEWARTRLGTRYAVTNQDGVAVAWMLKQEDAQEVRRRMTALLESPDAWDAANASLAMLRSKWNRYAIAVEAPRPATQRTAFEVVKDYAEKQKRAAP